MGLKKIQYAGKKTVLTYVYLHTGARYLLDLSERTDEGSVYTSLMSLVGTAFFLEAYLNHIGPKLLPYWSEVERALSPKAKLMMLCHELDVKPRWGKRPYQSFVNAFDFRNFMAHGKTEKVKAEWRSAVGRAHAISISVLQPKWEKMCNPREARRCYEDGERITEVLHAKAGFPGKPFITMAHAIATIKG